MNLYLFDFLAGLGIGAGLGLWAGFKLWRLTYVRRS